MSPNTEMDPCVSYGRGGAGNMRRRSSILDAWTKIASQPSNNKIAPCSSPDDHYVSSKSEPRASSSSQRRRASSMWSSSTAGEHRSVWKRLFRRGSLVEENEKVVESE
ncbi:uncharacterized protein K460DRAFT_102990 [Cucurbitaria berberidis CBS 394.84]|uniref:Uncharacterized protein n=1 Tax=Cucurbitaria berberidis CBS 394.84 TaxID=1168544 RepID=A0A9P4GGN0_9PLEO|nr:uncharacterized protein K460DRAFT_102990 [Cucurbitaria berberidis CBS 394.84]KAF1845099.1 hypothetical protein K460DRAFT_102990 [Cucurbitaria berberidis CBS 394.84]